MNSFELTNEIENILEEITEISKSQKIAYKIISEHYIFSTVIHDYIRYFEYCSTNLNAGTIAKDIINRKNLEWNSLEVQINKLNDLFDTPSDTLLVLFKFKEILNNYTKYLMKDAKVEHITSKHIDTLIDTYNQWLTESKSSKKLQLELLVDFEIAASSIRSVVNEIRVYSDTLKGNPITNKQGRLIVYLKSDKELKEFAVKLLAIGNIYLESLYLFDLKETDHPITINKIESGSQWIDILGYPKVIEFITSLITKGIDYLHRNYTKEGKIGQIPKKIESIESILSLTDSLKEAGIETEEIKDKINKAAIKITEDMNKLLKAEDYVRVNNIEYFLSESKENMIVKNMQQLIDSPKKKEEKKK